MKIRELHLKNYGKFSDEKVIFQEGIHIFYGENESGKTTLHTFIKSMLFGLERKKGRGAATDLFSMYEPWENPNYYAGILKFESGGKNFCLTRSFDKYKKSASLICEDDGEEFSLEHGDLEMLLGGLSEETYDNTVAIGQVKAKPNQSLAAELQNYATNYYATGKSDIDLDGALKKLQDEKKNAEKELGKLTAKKNSQRMLIEQERGFVRQEIEELETELEEIKEMLLQEGTPDETAESERKPYGIWALFLGVLLACVVSVVVLDVSPLIFTVVAAVYLGIEIVKKRKSPSKESSEESQYAKLLWEKEHLLEEIKEKTVICENLQEQLDELEVVTDEFVKLKRTMEAADFAADKLRELSEDVHKELEARLNQKASFILKEITGGKYEKLFVDEKLNMSLYTQGRRIPIEQVSRGTIEQIYFALRMAASEILYDEEYPVVLDDTFVYYDDKRVENTLRWLKNNRKQVIIFTCQKREEEILSRI